MTLRIRLAEPQDLPVIDGLGTRSYPGNYYEGHASFASKIIGNPETFWVATDDDYVVGYAISFPYVLGAPYPIDKIYAPIENPNCLYLHDVCVSAHFRKLDIGRRLVKTVLESDWPQAALVAALIAKRNRATGAEAPVPGLPLTGRYWSRKALCRARSTSISFQRGCPSGMRARSFSLLVPGRYPR